MDSVGMKEHPSKGAAGRLSARGRAHRHACRAAAACSPVSPHGATELARTQSIAAASAVRDTTTTTFGVRRMLAEIPTVGAAVTHSPNQV